jgi:prevent-host-death family protein
VTLPASSGRGSRSATFIHMPVIPQKELRNNVGEVLRRAEGGEEFTITVAGRPAARLGPEAKRSWVKPDALDAVFATPAPRDMGLDLQRMPGALTYPFE